MYFIQYHPLKEKLRNRSLSDREALPYFIVFIILPLALALEHEEGNDWDFVLSILNIVCTILGTIYVYLCNGGREGFNFIQKYVVLGWIVLIRLYLIILAVTITISEVFTIATDIEIEMLSGETNLFDVVLVVIIYIIYYQRLGRHIQDTIRESELSSDGTANTALRFEVNH